MIMRRFSIISLLTSVVVVAMGAGCSSSAPDTDSSRQKMVLAAEDEPTFEVAAIYPLEQATQDGTLPFIALPGGAPMETPCLERSRKAKQWTTANPEVIEALTSKAAEISDSLMKWIQAELADDESRSAMSSWRAEVYDNAMVVRHFNTDDVRFSADQLCITDNLHMLPADREVVTTLLGATAFSVLSETAMDPAAVKAVVQAGRKNRMQVKPVPTFPRATDEKGKPMFRKGRALFVAPDGTLVPQKDVPRPKDRPVFELQFKAPKGVFAAVGVMPKTRFASARAPLECQLNLIFDDMTPRAPLCLGSNQLGFGVAMGDNPGEVLVRAATTDATNERTIPFDSTAMIQVGGRGFAWVTPKQLEEGAELQLETLILHPDDKVVEEDLKKFSYKK